MRFCSFLVTVFGKKRNYVLPIPLGTFEFQSGRFGTPVLQQKTCEEGCRHPFFPIFLKGNKLTFSEFT